MEPTSTLSTLSTPNPAMHPDDREGHMQWIAGKYSRELREMAGQQRVPVVRWLVG